MMHRHCQAEPPTSPDSVKAPKDGGACYIEDALFTLFSDASSVDSGWAAPMSGLDVICLQACSLLILTARQECPLPIRLSLP